MRENEEVIIMNQEELRKVRYFRVLRRERIAEEWRERNFWEVRV